MPVTPSNNIQTIMPYTLSERFKKKFNSNNAVRLDWNEAEYTPVNEIKSIIADYLIHADFSLYPDVNNEELICSLADYCAVDKEQVQYFSGSDSALEYTARTYISQGDDVVIVAPTYDNFRVYVQSCGGQIHNVFYDDAFSNKISSLFKISYTPKIIYLSNPNNPTGVLITNEVIENILNHFPNTLLICDEAYYEFSGYSAAPLIPKYDNLLITRSFSKAFGLAGIRFGYIISHSQNLTYINRIRNGKNVNVVAQISALAALQNIELVYKYVDSVLESKRNLKDWLEANNIRVYDGHGNFLMVFCKEPSALVRNLFENEIYIRDRSSMPMLSGFVRITICTESYMVKLKKALLENIEHII